MFITSTNLTINIIVMSKIGYMVPIIGLLLTLYFIHKKGVGGFVLVLSITIN